MSSATQSPAKVYRHDKLAHVVLDNFLGQRNRNLEFCSQGSGKRWVSIDTNFQEATSSLSNSNEKALKNINCQLVELENTEKVFRA